MKIEEIKKLKKKFDSENPNTYKEFVCIVDEEYGDPSCVIDLNCTDDCGYGHKYNKKEDCPHWVEKIRPRPRKDIDVWEWLEKQAT